MQDDVLIPLAVKIKTVSPNRNDLMQIDLAIRSFRTAWGCISPDGAFRPGAADPTQLWIMIKSDATKMSELWRRSEISTDAKSSYAEMLSATDHFVRLVFFKARPSLFRTAWLGNVSLYFHGSTLYVGSVAARAQLAMWQQLRAFMDGAGALHPSTSAAIEAVT